MQQHAVVAYKLTPEGTESPSEQTADCRCLAITQCHSNVNKSKTGLKNKYLSK